MAKEKQEFRSIQVLFSEEALRKIIWSIQVTKMCHGDLLLDDDKAWVLIFKALKANKDKVIIKDI